MRFVPQTQGQYTISATVGGQHISETVKGFHLILAELPWATQPKSNENLSLFWVQQRAFESAIVPSPQRMEQ